MVRLVGQVLLNPPPLALAEAGGGWVGRGQDKQDPANSESMT
jgi:hypothetical protein